MHQQQNDDTQDNCKVPDCLPSMLKFNTKKKHMKKGKEIVPIQEEDKIDKQVPFEKPSLDFNANPIFEIPSNTNNQEVFVNQQLMNQIINNQDIVEEEKYQFRENNPESNDDSDIIKKQSSFTDDESLPAEEQQENDLEKVVSKFIGNGS